MSILVETLAFLPAVATIIVVLAAIADRREATSLKDLCTLDSEPLSTAEDFERSAA